MYMYSRRYCCYTLSSMVATKACALSTFCFNSAMHNLFIWLQSLSYTNTNPNAASIPARNQKLSAIVDHIVMPAKIQTHRIDRKKMHATRKTEMEKVVATGFVLNLFMYLSGYVVRSCRVLRLCRQLSFLMSFDGAQSWH